MTLWTAARQASLPFTNSQSLLKCISIESVMPSNCLILCHPCVLLPSIFPSIRIFSNESILHIRWPRYWSFSISPSSEYSGLISFRMDWLDLLAVQETLKSLLQHHSSKASIFWCSAFFMVTPIAMINIFSSKSNVSHAMWCVGSHFPDQGSRDKTCVPALGVRSLNHWSATG